MDESYTVDTMYDTILNTYSDSIDKTKINNVEKYLDNNNLSIKIDNSYPNSDELSKSYYFSLIYPNNFKWTTNENIITLNTDNVMNNLWVFMTDMEDDPLIKNLNIRVSDFLIYFATVMSILSAIEYYKLNKNIIFPKKEIIN